MIFVYLIEVAENKWLKKNKFWFFKINDLYLKLIYLIFIFLLLSNSFNSLKKNI